MYVITTTLIPSAMAIRQLRVLHPTFLFNFQNFPPYNAYSILQGNQILQSTQIFQLFRNELSISQFESWDRSQIKVILHLIGVFKNFFPVIFKKKTVFLKCMLYSRGISTKKDFLSTYTLLQKGTINNSSIFLFR